MSDSGSNLQSLQELSDFEGQKRIANRRRDEKMLISVREAIKSGNMIIFVANAKVIKSLARFNEIEDNVIIGVRVERKE